VGLERHTCDMRGAASCLLAMALAAGACTSSPVPGSSPSSSAASAASLPSESAVRDGRFITPVALDRGILTVEPAPAETTPGLFTQQQAENRIWASPTVAGSRSGAVMGFGLVSVNGRLAGDTVLRSLQGGPRPEHIPAWVGFAWGGITNCPDILTGASNAMPPPSSGYEAVVIPTDAPVSAFTYSARTSICGEPPTGPRVAMARYVVSVPWRSEGKMTNGRVTISYTPPVCGTEESMQTGGDASGYTISVFYSLWIHPLPVPPCPSPWLHTETLRVPSGPNPIAEVVLLHGKTGITRQIQLSPGPAGASG